MTPHTRDAVATLARRAPVVIAAARRPRPLTAPSTLKDTP